jgi:hypothetical protein
MKFSSIYIPTRPQPDTIVAIFLLKTYGVTIFSGIDTASYQVLSHTDQNKDEKEYLKEGKVLLDVGGGIFDHHNKPEKTTASELVAKALGIQNEPAIQKLLAYAKRDDFYGKGTQSDDPLDKAFGLSGLIAAMNKTHFDNPAVIVDTILPLLQAHHNQEKQRTIESPKEISLLRERGLFSEIEALQKKNTLKVCFVESDNVGLPGFLRATDGGRYDVVVQKRSTGHVNILTKPLKRPDLRPLAGLIRAEEYSIRSGISYPNPDLLKLPGRSDDVPVWYFDPATNSLQNGGVNPEQTEATKIPWETIKKLTEKGMALFEGSVFKQKNPSRVLYTALFVDSPDQLLSRFKPKHPQVYAHHLTLKYKPESIKDLEIGKKIELKIIGRVSDDNGDALLVETDLKTEGKYPHITLSCAEGFRPNYSNQMVEKAVLDGTVEYFDDVEYIETTEGYENGENKVIISL